MRPMVETYKGRRLRVEKGREWGTLRTRINGELIGTPYGSTPEAMAREIGSLRGYVDFADECLAKGETDRFGAYMYRGAPKSSK